VRIRGIVRSRFLSCLIHVLLWVTVLAEGKCTWKSNNATPPSQKNLTPSLKSSQTLIWRARSAGLSRHLRPRGGVRLQGSMDTARRHGVSGTLWLNAVSRIAGRMPARPLLTLREKRFVATGQFFVGAAVDGAAPTMACSGAQRLAAPTNRTTGAAGDTSRPYKWV